MKKTLSEFGAEIRRHPKIIRRYGRKLDSYTDQALAERYLELFPEHRDYVSNPPPTGQQRIANSLFGTGTGESPESRLRHLVTAPLSTGSGIFGSWADFYRDEAQHIRNRRDLIQTVEYGILAEQATQNGMNVATYVHARAKDHEVHAQKELTTHQTDETIRLRQAEADIQASTWMAERDIGLDGMDRRSRPEFRAGQLEGQLFDAIDRRDKESHPEKRQILDIRIDQLKEELRALGRMVQAGDGGGLSDDNEDTDRPAGPSASGEGNRKSVQVKGFRMGE
jgi:hypothetical protein